MTPVHTSKGLKKSALVHAVAIEKGGRRPLDVDAGERAGRAVLGIEARTGVAAVYLKWLAAISRSVRPGLFLSYSHKNAKDVEIVATHLRSLEHAGKVQVWSDHYLSGGDVWQFEIERRIQTANIIVLMLTPEYLVSEVVMKWEIPRIMERATREEVLVYSILARDCAWREFPWLACIETRPRKAKAVWPNARGTVDMYLAEIAAEIGSASAKYMWVSPIGQPEDYASGRSQ